MYWFIADEHFGHTNIIKYANRPFDNVEEMDETIIQNHNEVVRKGDIVIHAGDFSFKPREAYVRRLNGSHVFLKGNHDFKRDKFYGDIWERRINGQKIVVSHYAMRVWNCSHYNSWNLFGHTHGTLKPEGKQWDIGVDNNGFYPLSFDELIDIMKQQPDNFDLIKDVRR